ncbi:MAG TPA: MFS transporter [Anaeromyxobacteraceae bacterium]|nr:MFS transporter [Anaeromyxobacteraceae bacterium]
MPPDAPAQPARSPWLVFSAVAVGNFMSTLDGSIVNVALPTLGRELVVPIARLQWMVSAYLLVISATLLTAGRLGDLLGHRRVFVGGLSVFTLGSALCGLSSSLGALVASRCLQALGATAMMAIGPAILTAVFPPGMRGRALGAIGSVVALGLTAGPPIGGAIVQALSWRWIFFVNLPVGAAGVAWALRVLPRGRAAARAGLDLPGLALFAAALGLVLLALDAFPRGGGALPLAAAGAGAAALFVVRERRAAVPVLDAVLLRSRAFSAGLAAGLLSYAAMFSQTFLTPFYLARVKGLPPGGLGLMLAAVPVALSVASPAAGWVNDRVGPRGVSLVGLATLAGGLLALSACGAEDGLPSVAARLALCGAGMGLFQAPNNAAVMGAVPRERLGSGGGLLATARNVGMAAGVAISGALFASRAGGAADVPAFLSGWALALRAGAALAIAAGLVSLVRSAPAGRGGRGGADGA